MGFEGNYSTGSLSINNEDTMSFQGEDNQSNLNQHI